MDSYGFDLKRIQSLKDKVQEENSKYRLLIILEGYDELREEFLYKNLYSSNYLASWGPQFSPTSPKIWPKVIYSCRSEFINGRSGHEKWFIPEIPGIDYNCQIFYESWVIQDFTASKDEYLNLNYLHELKEIMLKEVANDEI